MGEYKVREIAQQAAEATVRQFCERLGIENIAEARGDLDHLRKLVKAAEARSQESRKTVFAIIGGAVMAVITYFVTSLTFKGHP